MSTTDFKYFELRGSYANRICRAVTVDRDYLIGSDPSCDIEINGENVQAQHVTLHVGARELTVLPFENAQVCVNGQRITNRSRIHDRDLLAFGAAQFQVLLRPHHVTDAGGDQQNRRAPPEAKSPRKQILTLGRSPHADCRIDTPLAANTHAFLIRLDNGDYALEDAGTILGTYLNGIRLSQRVIVRTGDLINIAGIAVRFDPRELVHSANVSGLTFETHSLVISDPDTGKAEGGAGVDLVIAPGEHVAIISRERPVAIALLRTIAGRQRPVSGTLKINGYPAASLLPALAPLVGYVAAEAFYGRTLSVEREINFGAQLRLPPDTTVTERHAHQLRVLLQTRPGSDTRSCNDPEYQQALALELLTLPACLLLEPPALFSGFAGGELDYFAMLQQLRFPRRTVITAATDAHAARGTDLVALLNHGQLVFFGPPANAPAYFGVADITAIPAVLDSCPARQLADAYKVSHYYETYVRQRRLPDRSMDPPPASSSPARPFPTIHQTRAGKLILRREMEALARDRLFLAVSLLQPTLLTVLLCAWHTGSEIINGAALTSLTLAAIWLGQTTACHLIVPARWRLARECQLGVRTSTWLLWQMPLLLGINAVQSALLLPAFFCLTPVPASILATWVVLTTTSASAMALGLTLSSCLHSWTRIAAAILLVMGLQMHLAAIPLQASSVSVVTGVIGVSYWGHSALNAAVINPPPWAPVIAGLLALVIQGSMFVTLALRALHGQHSR